MQFINNREGNSKAQKSIEYPCHPSIQEARLETHSLSLENNEDAGDQSTVLPRQYQTLLTFPFYDEIKRLWIKNGQKKHEKIVKQNPAPTTADFSFSPYDNCF